MSQLTPRTVRSRANYTGLACLLLAAVGYVGVHAQTTTSATGQPASTISANPGVSQAILDVSSATQAAVNAADFNDGNISSNSHITTNHNSTTEQTATDDSVGLRVTVNGQSIDVPTNGSVNQTIPNEPGNGQTNVSVTSSQSSTGSSNNYSFTSTRSNDSSSTSSVDFSMEHTSP